MKCLGSKKGLKVEKGIFIILFLPVKGMDGWEGYVSTVSGSLPRWISSPEQLVEGTAPASVS